MRLFVQIALTVLILAAGGVGLMLLIEHAPRPDVRPQVTPVPPVRVRAVQAETLQLRVHSQGTVLPRTEIQLVPEVSGRVTAVSPSLAAGGFFAVDEVLVQIDQRDFELAITSARAEVERAKFSATWEQAEADSALAEWRELGLPGEAPSLVRREPQLQRARAGMAAAEASLQKAQLDLTRTRLTAPFAGRVRAEHVDVGQFVARGAMVAEIYAVDYVEVRLPLPTDELAFVDLPLVFRGQDLDIQGPEVILIGQFAGRSHSWTGRIVRTEGQIDTGTRMVHAVARVEDPYGGAGEQGRPPLAVGMFVEAEILGHAHDNVMLVPRSAVRNGDRVLVVDADDRLRVRDVDILRRQRDTVVVTGGLTPGERLCTSPLEIFSDGMRVRPVTASGEATQRPMAGR